MRTGPSAKALASSVSWRPMVSSWLGVEVLADVVPVLSGKITWTVGQEVTATLTMTVPGTSVENGRTRSWRPGRDPKHPLARYGQKLDVSLLVDGYLLRLGRFGIQDWKDGDGGEIEVSGAGILQNASDDRLIVPTGPRDNGTLKSEFARLTPDYMTVQFDASLVDRACPKAMEWDEERLKALYEIADAWPARLREDAWGGIQVLPPLPETPVPVMSFTDGEGGTLISAPTEDTREGSYNVFVARSSADGVEAQAVAAVEGGPMAASGEYRPVPTFWSSPLLANEAQCLAAAQTRRSNSTRQSIVRRVELVPDPRIEIDDAVELIVDKDTDDQVVDWGYVIGVELPLTVTDGPMQMDVATF
ncbi:hypothetical protein [Microbacterium sp. NPDC089696]|uniref:hypothetical protein n=1 Tax=Microbacterium sp. NPDC089696 TaxID=3364199 RepID=UPI0037FF3524